MKKVFLAALMLFIGSHLLQAQTQAIKTNLLGWAALNSNIQYEYSSGSKLSFGLGIGYKLPATISVDALAEQTDGDKYSYTGDLKVNGVSFTPFLRWYPSGAIRGFYLEPFLRYYNYDIELPYEYDKDNTLYNGNATGYAKAFGGGLNIGGQIISGEHFVIDIFAGAGIANGNVRLEVMDPNLDEADYAEIKQTIEDNKDTEVNVFILNSVIDKIEADANSNSAWAQAKGIPVPIFRIGISLGYAF
ncbi:MAG: DUF3575 domain-containing protein [Chitinophagales bacterium]|nr:DUF3575 domain-containing protein [Bacteroidota bacterium]MCB9042327.1 DUF3575 domain-containing protein [Chitinophagales bacterium]